jgi:hypothetical protein
MPKKPEKNTDSSKLEALNKKLPYDYQHIFKSHQLRSYSNQNQEITQKELWPSYIICFGFVLLLFAYLAIFKKFGLLVKSCFSLQASRTLQREEFRISSKESLFMSAIYLFGLSFIVYRFDSVINFFPFFEDQLIKFSIIISVALGIYILKLFFLWLSGFLLNQEKVIDEYRYNVFTTSFVVGILLLIVSAFLEFVQINDMLLILFGFFLFFFFYFFRVFKGFLIAREIRNFTGFQLFVYLCGLEILPVVVLITFLLRLSSYTNNF